MKKIHKILLISTILIGGLGIVNNMEGQLKYPLDEQSKNIIKQAVGEIIEEDIHSLIWKKTFHWITFFESLDGFATTGTVVADKDKVLFTTGAVSGNSANMVKTPAWQGIITFSQKSYWRTNIAVDTITAVTEYLVVGSLSSGSYYGFKTVNDSLKGVSYDGTTEKTVDLMTVAVASYNLEARYTPSNKIVFYVNGDERGTIMVNLPSPVATPNVNLFEFKITTNATGAKTMQVSFFEYLQSRNVLR